MSGKAKKQIHETVIGHSTDADKEEGRSLCWRCKFSCGDYNRTCPWVYDRKPVKGWEATKGKMFRMGVSKGVEKKVQSYTVIQCPLFQSEYEFLDYSEFVQALLKTQGITRDQYNLNRKKWTALFFKDKGEEIPAWIAEKIGFTEEDAKVDWTIPKRPGRPPKRR